MSGYDAWKLATPPEYERAAKLESLIDGSEHLSFLRRRAETAAGRADVLTLALVKMPKPGARRSRLERILNRATRVARYRANDLQSAIEDSADDYDGPDTTEEARGER